LQFVVEEVQVVLVVEVDVVGEFELAEKMV
jgi:hypothetical protein